MKAVGAYTYQKKGGLGPGIPFPFFHALNRYKEKKNVGPGIYPLEASMIQPP